MNSSLSEQMRLVLIWPMSATNGSRVTGGSGGVVKVTHLSGPVPLRRPYIRPQRRGHRCRHGGTNSIFLWDGTRTVSSPLPKTLLQIYLIFLINFQTLMPRLQVLTMRSSLAGILLLLGFIQNSWQVPLLETGESSR